MVTRLNKYKTNNNSHYVNIGFDITSLDIMCNYIISDNKSIHRSNIINMKNVFDIMDMSQYNNDTERLGRIDFINKGIEARLDYNLSNRDMIIKHISGGLNSVNTTVYEEMNNNEVNWVNETISAILKDFIIYNDVDRGIELMNRFKMTDYKDRGEVVKEISDFVNSMQVKFRKSRAHNDNDITFKLTGNEFIEGTLATYDKLASPSNRLVFGTQALNIITGGGVEGGRVYTILGLPGEGKSSTLLDMAIQLKRYNKNYICKDPTKRPCVVLLVMENGVKESVQRAFNMCVGDEMLNYSRDEVLDVFKVNGNLAVNENDPIDIIIKFKSNLSVDTSYLYTLTEDLEDEGYEVICFIQDYIKRIHSAEIKSNSDNTRLELGAIINEFKTFATFKDIPVITASQLNRAGTSVIDEARIKNKADLVRLLGRGNVGESNLIIENSDWIALIAPEYSKENGARYLGMQRVKSRYRIDSNIHCVYMPYVVDTIKFVEDYYSAVPVHKITMREEEPINGIQNMGNTDLVNITEIDDIRLKTDNSNNIFLNNSMIVS